MGEEPEDNIALPGGILEESTPPGVNASGPPTGQLPHQLPPKTAKQILKEAGKFFSKSNEQILKELKAAKARKREKFLKEMEEMTQQREERDKRFKKNAERDKVQQKAWDAKKNKWGWGSTKRRRLMERLVRSEAQTELL